MSTKTWPKPVLKDDLIYSGDNGTIFCGKHAGASARYTGRDISGQRVERLTDADMKAGEQLFGVTLCCETCGATP